MPEVILASHPIDVSYLLNTLGKVIMAHLKAGKEDSLLALKYLNTSYSFRWMEAYEFSFVNHLVILFSWKQKVLR